MLKSLFAGHLDLTISGEHLYYSTIMIDLGIDIVEHLPQGRPSITGILTVIIPHLVYVDKGEALLERPGNLQIILDFGLLALLEGLGRVPDRLSLIVDAGVVGLNRTPGIPPVSPFIGVAP